MSEDINDIGAWGFPSPLYNFTTGQYDNGGMIWYGDRQATDTDRAKLKAHPMTANWDVDELSTCGRDDPAWTTFYETNKGEYPYKQSVVIL